MEVEIVSERFIKPSFPTPDHLKTHKLSLLDQFVPPAYTEVALFYSFNQINIATNYNDISKRSLQLQHCLSDTLIRFYPLAGRVEDRLSIDCNDEGAYYVVAKTNSSISDYLNHIDLKSMHMFLPKTKHSNRHQVNPGSLLLMVQETNFKCGGFVIGLLISHLIADGVTMSAFLNDWATTTNKSGFEGILLDPYFDAQNTFPQVDVFPEEATMRSFWRPFVKTGKVSPRRFVFDGPSINSLKAKAKVEKPTRVEVVSCLLSKCIMAVSKSKSTFAIHLVNLRRRANPPLSPCLMGNFLWLATAVFTPDHALDLTGLVRELRDGISRIDGNFVKGLGDAGGLSKLCEAVKEMSFSHPSTQPVFSGVDVIVFTSWCNFGLYEVDFGLGKPIWASHCVAQTNFEMEMPMINSVFLMDTRDGKGIEALVFLDERDMISLAYDTELLEHASMDPSPLKIGNNEASFF